MTEPQAIRAVGYLRQSERKAGESEQTSLSLTSQEQAFHRWCASNNAVPVAVVKDHDLRGYDDTRPGLQELRAVASSTPVDVLWVLSLSRFAKDMILQEMTWRGLRKLGVKRIYSEVEGYVDDDFLRGIYGLMHERSRHEQSAHLRNAFAARARAGAFPQGRTAFGYKRPQTIQIHRANGDVHTRETGPPVIDPEEAAILRELFTRVAAGDSIRSIARSFRTRHPSRFGGRWGISYLTDIVRKPIYCGDIVHNGEVVAHNPDWAIVDKALWNAANARLNRQPRMRARSDRERPWMDGYVYHSCGSLATSRPDGSGRLNFKCNGEGNQQRCDKPRGSISYPMLDHAIRAALRMDLGSIRPPEETIAYARELVGGKRALAARTTLDRQQARAQSKYERLLDLYGDGAISKQVLDERIAAVTEELDAIKAERAALPEPPNEDEIRAVFATLHTFADVMDDLEPNDWRELLAAVGRAVFDETGVRIEYLPEIAPHVTAHTIPAPRWSRAPSQA